jgi:branched-chain amino acid transport system substrate-binding protein
MPRVLRRRRLLGSAALAVIAPAGMPASAQVPQPAPPPPPANELRFAALFPLSGPLALPGDECVRGIEMAAEERGAAGGLLGRPIRIQRVDVTEPAQAQAEARRLAGLAGAERPMALFGTLDGQLALAASQAAELAGMPYLELVAATDALTDRGFRLLFRACPRATELASTALEAVPPLAALLGSTPASLRLGVLHDDALSPQALADALEARMKEVGYGLAARAGYRTQPPGEIATALRRLRAAETEVLIHCSRGANPLPVFRALREEGWRPRAHIGLGGGYALADTAQALGPELDGVLLGDLPQPRIDDRFAPGVAGFGEAYRRRYGAAPRSGHSLACYAGAQLFFEAAQRGGGTEAARLRAGIQATDLPVGALPNGWGARFDDRGQNGRARTVLLQWQGAALNTVLPAEAAVAPLLLPPA